MALDFDDLIATMKGSGIGQEAMDLRALHAHLSQTLFLPPGQSQAGLPTPQSSFYSSNPPPPPSSLTSAASTSYNMNTSTSYHPSSFKSDYDQTKTGGFQRSYDAGGAGSRGPIPERGFPPTNGSPYGHHSSFGASPSASGSPYPPPAPSSGSNAFEANVAPAALGRQTRSQTRSAASAAHAGPLLEYQQQEQAFPGMNFHSGHGPGGERNNGGGRGWAPPPTPRSLSLVRGGGGGTDDVEMGA